MLNALLIAIITVLAVIVAARLVYAFALLGVMVVSALVRGVIVPVFGALFWVIAQIVMLPVRIVAAVFRPFSLAPASGLVLGPLCSNASCRCSNPTQARYCRRCGASVAAF